MRTGTRDTQLVGSLQSHMGNGKPDTTLYIILLLVNDTLIAAFNREIFCLERFVWDPTKTVQLLI